jgi:hypothetical protein
LAIFWFRQELGEEFTFLDGQEARRSRRRTENVRLSPTVPPFTKTKVSMVQEARRSYRRTENVRLSPLVPPFTKTKVSTGGQEVTSEDREREAESSGASVHKD